MSNSENGSNLGQQLPIVILKNAISEWNDTISGVARALSIDNYYKFHELAD